MSVTYQPIRELIRSMQEYLQSPEEADAQFVRDESVEYNDLCHKVNERLTEVTDLIGKGLREDAIAVSLAGGDLLELFEILDFPERDQWMEFINQFGLQFPPPLDYESATKLNHAHGRVAELGPLLKKHRLLNLARAPLGQRIASLQELHLQDNANPVWKADGIVLQNTRLEQLRDQVDHAIESENAKLIRAIQKEIQQTQWWVDVPNHLRTKIKHAASRFRKQSRRQELQDQILSLQDAYAAYDVSTALSLASTVVANINELGITPDDPLAIEAQASLDWVLEKQTELADEDRAARLIGALEAALDNHSDRDTLSHALAAAEGLGERLPTSLMQRGRERIDSFEMIARRKSLLAIAAGVLFLAAAGGGIAWIVLQQRETARVAELESTFTRLIEDERFEEAEGYLESVSDTTRRRAVFIEGKATIEQALTKERQRTAAFNEVLQELGADTSGKPNYPLISRLRNLAKTDIEQNELALQEAKAEDLRLKEKADAGEKSSAAMRQTQQTVNEFFESDLIGRERQQRLLELKTDVTTLIARLNSTSPGLAASASQLSRLLDVEERRIQKDMKRDDGIDEITQSIGNVDDFLSTIQRFVSENADDPMAIGLSDIQTIRGPLTATQAWIHVLQDTAFRNPRTVNGNDAKAWLALFADADATAPDHTLASLPRRLKPHYDAVAKRPEAIETLKSFFKLDLLRKPMFVYTDPQTNARYFSPMPADHGGRTPQVVTYYADPQLLEQTNNFGLRYASEVQPNVSLAGHTEFAQKANSLVASLTESNFTPTCFRLCSMLRQVSDDRIDPIFKSLLLRTILETSMPASEPLRVGFESMVKRFTESEVDWTSNWFSPRGSDLVVDESRDAASGLLATMVDWPQREQEMKNSFQGFHSKRPSLPKWVGWVVRRDDRWTAMINSTEFDEDAVDNQGSFMALRNGEFVSINNNPSNREVSRVTSQIVGLPVYWIRSDP